MTQTTLVPVATTALPAECRKVLSLVEVLEAIDNLSEEDREELYELTRERRIKAFRDGLEGVIAQSRRDFAEGKCVAMTPQQIIDEILS